MHSIRQPAVAGAFYPAQKQVLANDLDAMLTLAKSGASAPGFAPGQNYPKAIVVPQAGYRYFGQTRSN